MTEINPEKIALDEEMASRKLDQSPISLLESIRNEGRVWDDLCEQYGVENPEPPWKVTLDATCELLEEESCALPGVERRWEEDQLSESHYSNLPFPERQLLALAHTLIRRGMISEEELARHMKVVDGRLHMADGAYVDE